MARRTATLLATVVGMLAALAVAEMRQGGRWLDAGVMLPLGVSGVTVGLGMLVTFAVAPFVATPLPNEGIWQPTGKLVDGRPVVYQTFLRPQDQPAIWLNQKTMEIFRPQMEKLYYDPAKYGTYLEQLGIKYPTVR